MGYLQKRFKSFGYAFRGIKEVFGKEANMNIHILAAIAVVVAGFVVKLNTTEWCFVVFAMGSVISAELFNSAIERTIDLLHPERAPLAGKVKDIAAGAVLVTAFAAAIIGLIVFVPKVIQLLGGQFL